MQALDVNSLFARAEAAFASGRLEEARAGLHQVQKRAGDHPAVLHLLALVEKKRGDLEASAAAFRRALNLAPRDSQIAGNYANLLAERGDSEGALRLYEAALQANPEFKDARYNRAILLQKLGRLEEALAELDKLAAARASARISSARGGVLKNLGRLDEAAAAFDAAVQAEPRRVTALHGRARIAMERGEDDAAQRYARLEALSPDDPHIALGAAEACVDFDPQLALRKLEEVVARFPDWPDAHGSLSRLRWELGERQRLTESMERRLAVNPANRELWLALIGSLSGVDRHMDAADAAARAAAAMGEDPAFRLIEAANASEGGDAARADRLFERLPALPGASLARARHELKKNDPDRADRLLEAARKEAPEDIAVWGWTGIVWRTRGDSRAEWLYQPDRLIGTQSLDLPARELKLVADEIRALHHARSFPVGQSLRGGTQTRGRLFDRLEAGAVKLRRLVLSAIREYWAGLPGEDPTHPLLGHRGKAPNLAGSWSVRLTDGGFHVAHIHPNGLLSSACYLHLPPLGEGYGGWLELGGAPADIKPAPEPLLRVEPRVGRLVLFPSYMFHGTAPFTAGERLTVAFDVVAV